MSLPKHIIENYEHFVAAGERTWEQIAEQADKDDAKPLAAYARSRISAESAPAGGTEQNGPDYESLTVADLKALAAERGLQIKSTALKNDYVEALAAADAEAEAAKKAAESDGQQAGDATSTGSDPSGSSELAAGSSTDAAGAPATPPAQS
jgi:hypothetical protein